MRVSATPFAAVAAVLTLAAAIGAPRAGAATLDGQKIFLGQKCNVCHTVSSASIEATGKIKAPDLAGATAKEDADWLVKYLRRDADRKGKKHIKPFTGSDEELGALVAWLQKQPAKK